MHKTTFKQKIFPIFYENGTAHRFYSMAELALFN